MLRRRTAKSRAARPERRSARRAFETYQPPLAERPQAREGSEQHGVDHPAERQAKPGDEEPVDPGGRVPRHSLSREHRRQTRIFPQNPLQGSPRIEQGIGKLKRFGRIAPRCEETAQNFAAFISRAWHLHLGQSVHTA
jgi:hypothetical protein